MLNGNRIKKFFILFIVSTISATLAFGILVSIRTTIIHGLKIGIVFGILLGFSTVFVFLILDLIARKTIPHSADICQSRLIISQGQCNDVIEKCFAALKNIGFVKKLQYNEAQKQIVATTKMSWASFGEEMTIRCDQETSTTVKVTIISKPLVKTTMIDYGKNFKNVETFQQAILKG